MKQYVYSFDDEGFYSDTFDSIEAALAEAQADSDDNEVVFIGESQEIKPTFEAWQVIERLQENAYDEAGDIASHYLDGLSVQAIDQLDELLAAWIEKYAQPNFYRVDNIKEYRLKPREADHG